MISKISPLNNDKQYIIPTKKWLKPIEPLILDDINTSGLIMIADFIEKEKRDDIIEINKIIKDMPNFVKTYCSFSCLETFDALDTKYDKINSFCNAKADFITIEIMRKYINKLELSEVINILKQLLLAQLYIFNKTGFLHNDIHLGNILVKKSKEDITLNYKINIIDNNIPINKHRINIITNFLPLISDFDRASIYNQPHITEEEYNDQNTLGGNIYDTFNRCIVLLKNKDEKELIYQKINEKNINIEKYINFSKKNLRSFYKKNYNYEKYINEESKYMLAFSCMLINLLETNSTSDWF
jgi:hypothetical protein